MAAMRAARAAAFLFATLYLGLLFFGSGLPLGTTRRRWQANLLGWAPPLVFAPAMSP